MGKFLVINGADFSNIAFDKVKIIDSKTVELAYNKAFLLKNYNDIIFWYAGSGDDSIVPSADGTGL